ncbi:endo-1,4-beta-xylanase 5-like [Tasmannia lanceolata]|uniref:endo-1,4-beta-xylanase 5-like n=1 Tax=Tasmannia lanceolata TaxID=3420 RepID=UPI00406343AA
MAVVNQWWWNTPVVGSRYSQGDTGFCSEACVLKETWVFAGILCTEEGGWFFAEADGLCLEAEVFTQRQMVYAQRQRVLHRGRWFMLRGRGFCTEADGFCTEADDLCTEANGLCTEADRLCMEANGLCTEADGLCTEADGLRKKLVFRSRETLDRMMRQTLNEMCLAEPHKPQYGGGILVNPEFNHGLRGWSRFGGAKIERRLSKAGNTFIVAHSRNKPYDGFSQKLYMQKEMLYTFSAWVQISEGKAPVTAVLKMASGYRHAGAVVAESGCWSMLKGGLTVNISGRAELYFESKNTAVEIWVDSVSLQPFTEEEWRAHHDESIEKTRKRKVRLHAANAQGNNLAGATVSITLTKANFPFGNAISSKILNNIPYQNWFTSRFSVTVFENELKWYDTENTPGKEDYSVPDAMLDFAVKNGIAVRGHNIFWDDPQYQPSWVMSLSPDQLRAAAEKRITSVVSRYAGKILGWDVMNENLHFSFYESKLGADASANFFQRAHQLDPRTTMFMNEYNTIEESADKTAAPENYLQKLRQIQNLGPTGIGLEGHFNTPNIPYMRSSIDTLAAAHLPIWLTEVDVAKSPNQAQYLEQILREGHGHPAVTGIVMWAGWHPEGCNRMCLTDNNFINLPTGNVVDKLINEWRPTNLVGTTDNNGFFEVPLFHGDYNVTVLHPSSSFTKAMKVATQTQEEEILHVKLYA